MKQYCISMAKKAAEISKCPKCRVGVTVQEQFGGMPCGSGTSTWCKIGSEFGCGGCTLDKALFSALANTLSGCKKNQVANGTVYIVALGKNGEILPIQLNDFCRLLLEAYPITKVIGLDPITELPVDLYPTTPAPRLKTKPTWEKIPTDQVLQNPERATAICPSLANPIDYQMMWAVANNLLDKGDPHHPSIEAIKQRISEIQSLNHDSTGELLSEELALLTKLQQLEETPYFFIQDMERKFPQMYEGEYLDALLLRCKLSCICAAGNNGETRYLLYLAKDGAQHLQWISTLGKMLESMQQEAETLRKSNTYNHTWAILHTFLTDWEKGSNRPMAGNSDMDDDLVKTTYDRYQLREVSRKQYRYDRYAMPLETLLLPYRNN